MSDEAGGEQEQLTIRIKDGVSSSDAVVPRIQSCYPLVSLAVLRFVPCHQSTSSNVVLPFLKHIYNMLFYGSNLPLGV